MSNTDWITNKLMEIHREVGQSKAVSEENRETIRSIKETLDGNNGHGHRIWVLERERRFVRAMAVGVASVFGIIGTSLGKIWTALTS